jgi:benzodiazapine receptor
MASNHDRRALAASIAFCEAFGLVPGYLTRDAFDGWYDSLEKPDATPPGGVFGPVWTTLYLLMGVARHLVSEECGEGTRTALFDLQLLLNASWTLVFFGNRSVVGGVPVIVALWLAIVATVVAFARVSRTAALLLVPYLLWVSFATYLNVGLWRLNR